MKLGNQGFLDKAPEAVVKQQRQKLEELQRQLASLAQTLTELDK